VLFLVKEKKQKFVGLWICAAKVASAQGQLITYSLITAAIIPIQQHSKIKAEAMPYQAEYIEYFAKREKPGCLRRP